MTKKLFLDAGHGQNDSGAVGNGLLEKNITLEIALGIEKALKNFEGIEVKQSRTNDTFIPLKGRTDAANEWGADYFLSIHVNSSVNAAANGYEDFIYNGNTNAETQAFQNVMNEQIFGQIKSYGVQNRGKNKANFHVLRESNMPALLTENLFIVNKGDSDKLKNMAFKQDLIAGHVMGLEKFLGLKKRQTEPPKTTDKLYKVQVGAFANRDNAEGLLKVLGASGFLGGFIIEE